MFNYNNFIEKSQSIPAIIRLYSHKSEENVVNFLIFPYFCLILRIYFTLGRFSKKHSSALFNTKKERVGSDKFTIRNGQKSFLACLQGKKVAVLSQVQVYL